MMGKEKKKEESVSTRKMRRKWMHGVENKEVAARTS